MTLELLRMTLELKLKRRSNGKLRRKSNGREWFVFSS